MSQLAPADYVALAAFEEVLRRQLPPLSKLTWDSVGYVADGDKIVELSLFGCELKAIPEEIGCLDCLKRLNVRRNSICKFPASMSALGNLEVISAERNRLTSIPNVRGSAASMRELYFANNGITDISNIGHLPALTILDLDHNGVVSLGDNLCNSAALKVLNLGSKKISTLADPDIYNPAPLRKYHFPGQPRTPFELQAMIFGQTFNRIERIGNLDALERLEELSIVFNRLSALPDDIGRLRKLRLLDASYNKLTAVPRGLGMLEHLEVVDLSHNYISAVPTFIADPARLDLRGNPVG